MPEGVKPPEYIVCGGWKYVPVSGVALCMGDKTGHSGASHLVPALEVLAAAAFLARLPREDTSALPVASCGEPQSGPIKFGLNLAASEGESWHPPPRERERVMSASVCPLDAHLLAKVVKHLADDLTAVRLVCKDFQTAAEETVISLVVDADKLDLDLSGRFPGLKMLWVVAGVMRRPETLAGLRHLRRLDLFLNSEFDARHLEPLAGQLTSLGLRGSLKGRMPAFLRVEKLVVLGKLGSVQVAPTEFPRLKCLEIHDDGAVSIKEGSCFSKVETLVMVGSRDGGGCATAAFPQVRSVDLESCGANDTPVPASVLVAPAPTLQKLRMWTCVCRTEDFIALCTGVQDPAILCNLNFKCV